MTILHYYFNLPLLSFTLSIIVYLKYYRLPYALSFVFHLIIYLN